MLLLEKLSPTERAAYVLREAFDYPYRQIAEILQLEEANTRQLVTRARQHITDGRRTPVNSVERRRLFAAFIDAAQKGEIAALEGLLASDVISHSDGGGIVRAARVPIAGRERVAKFIGAVASHFWTGVTLSWIQTNGQRSVLMSRDRAGAIKLTGNARASPVARTAGPCPAVHGLQRAGHGPALQTQTARPSALPRFLVSLDAARTSRSRPLRPSLATLTNGSSVVGAWRRRAEATAAERKALAPPCATNVEC